MSEVLDNIVNCEISIESPVEDAASFGTIMLIGDGPRLGGKDLKAVDRYASLSEVEDAGWREDEAVYQAARAAFMQEHKPEFLYIAVRQAASGGADENTGAAEEEPVDTEKGTKESTGSLERFSETARRVTGMAGWYGLALAGAEDTDINETAELIESTEKIFAFSTQREKNPLLRTDYMRTFGIYSEAADENAHAAWLAEGFSYDPGSETWAYKMLKGVTPSELTTRQMRSLEEENLNYYIPCAGRNITRNGRMAGGEWIDVIRFRDWLKNQMQIRIFELFVKNPKIPYLDTGITLVENQMRAALQAGQKAGGIAETEFDENDEPIEGYTVTVPRAASLSSAQRASRTLRDCRFTARLAGAIHIVELKGSLVYSK